MILNVECAYQAGMNVSVAADLVGMFSHNHLYFTENSLKRRKFSMIASSPGKNAFLISEVRGE